MVKIARRRAACVMLSETKHLWFVRLEHRRERSQILRCAQDDIVTECFIIDFW